MLEEMIKNSFDEDFSHEVSEITANYYDWAKYAFIKNGNDMMELETRDHKKMMVIFYESVVSFEVLVRER